MKISRKEYLAGIMICMCFLSLMIFHTGAVYAAPEDPETQITVTFMDENGEAAFDSITKHTRYGSEITVPAIRNSYLPDEYQDRDDITSCWIIEGTEEAYYPGDEFLVEDGEGYTITDSLAFLLVPDDSVLDYERVALSFLDNDGNAIEDYEMEDVRVGAEIELPDPSPYGGNYWSYFDRDDNPQLLKKGDKYRVTEDAADFTACGDRTVLITYYYPDAFDSIASEHEPGDVYKEKEAHVGDFITLEYSPGNIVFGCTFRGWEDYSSQYEGLFRSGQVFQVKREEDIHFMSIYEEDENWDPTAGDGPQNVKNDITENLNEIAGAGADYVVNNDTQTIAKPNGGGSTGFAEDDKDKSAQNGDLTSKTKKDHTLSNPNEDQYGRPIADGGDPTKPLMQDDSLFAMDIYGNAFAYPYWATSEEERIEFVTNRLTQYKGNSWANFINKHEGLADAVKRFEEREMDMLRDDNHDDLKAYRKQWRGWMDDYSDIPTAAATNYNNRQGEANRVLARVKYSVSWEDYVFYQYFYDKSMRNVSMYGFNGLSGLSPESTENMRYIYNALILDGYSEMSASVVCAWIWDQTNGTFSPGSMHDGGYGIAGWEKSDCDSYRETAEAAGYDWNTIEVQTEKLVQWLNQKYIMELNEAMKSNTGIGIKEFKKLSAYANAADIWCSVFYEGYDEPAEGRIQLFNGKYYEEAEVLRKNTQLISKAKTKTSEGYSFDASKLIALGVTGTRLDVITAAYNQLGKKYKWGAEGPDAFDCSGLTSWCYRQIGINIPRVSSDQIRAGRIISKEMLRPGDLVVWKGHVGMYVGNGEMIEAMTKEKPILKTNLDSRLAHSSLTFLGFVSVLD